MLVQVIVDNMFFIGHMGDRFCYMLYIGYTGDQYCYMCIMYVGYVSVVIQQVLITTVHVGYKRMNTNSRLHLTWITTLVDYCTARLPMAEQYNYIRVIIRTSIERADYKTAI